MTILLVLVRLSFFFSSFLTLLLDVELAPPGELSSFPFAFNFSIFFPVAFVVGEAIGALPELATLFVMELFEVDQVVVPFGVLRGVLRGILRGEAGCCDTDLLGSGE